MYILKDSVVTMTSRYHSESKSRTIY